jgi:hypothetical protein
MSQNLLRESAKGGRILRRSQIIALGVTVLVIAGLAVLMFGSSRPVFINHTGVIEMNSDQESVAVRFYYRYPRLRVADFARQLQYEPDPNGGPSKATRFVGFVGDGVERVQVSTVVNEGLSWWPLRRLELVLHAVSPGTTTITGIAFNTPAGELVCPVGRLTIIADTRPVTTFGGAESLHVVSARNTTPVSGPFLMRPDCTISTYTMLPAEYGSVTASVGVPTSNAVLREARIEVAATPPPVSQATCLIYRPVITTEPPDEFSRLSGPMIEALSLNGTTAGSTSGLARPLVFRPHFARNRVAIVFAAGALCLMLSVCYIWRIGMKPIKVGTVLAVVAQTAGLLFALVGVATTIVFLIALSTDQDIAKIIYGGIALVSWLALKGISSYLRSHEQSDQGK